MSWSSFSACQGLLSTLLEELEENAGSSPSPSVAAALARLANLLEDDLAKSEKDVVRDTLKSKFIDVSLVDSLSCLSIQDRFVFSMSLVGPRALKEPPSPRP